MEKKVEPPLSVLNIYVEEIDIALTFFNEAGFYMLFKHTYINNMVPLIKPSKDSDLVIQILELQVPQSLRSDIHRAIFEFPI